MAMTFDLAKWVAAARKHANLTQEELAHRVNLGGKANISAFENGRTSPTFKTIWDIGQVCCYPLPKNEYANAEIQNTEKIHQAAKNQSTTAISALNSMQTTLPRGIYRHYKGNLYEVLDLARHSETEEILVVYRALYGSYGLWVRPLAMFTEQVGEQPRFELVQAFD